MDGLPLVKKPRKDGALRPSKAEHNNRKAVKRTRLMIEFLPKQKDCLNALGLDSAAEVVLFGGAAGGAKSMLKVHKRSRVLAMPEMRKSPGSSESWPE